MKNSNASHFALDLSSSYVLTARSPMNNEMRMAKVGYKKLAKILMIYVMIMFFASGF